MRVPPRAGAAGVRRRRALHRAADRLPWHILSTLSIMYLLSLPLGWKSYRDQERALAAQSVVPVDPAAPHASTPYTPGAPEIAPDDRPARLN